MADSKTFNGITQTVWDCVKTTSEKEQGTVYSGADQGTATTKTIVGTVVLSYTFTVAAGTLAYKIDKKPGIVSANQIWDGIQKTITGCQSGS